MQTTEHWHTASDGKRIFFSRHLPESPPRAVVHIAHGVAEHGARYARVAEVLSRAGYAVYVDDHRGHGRTAATVEERGVFEGGAARVLADLVELLALEKREHPGRPLVLFGHSMGSFFAQALAGTHGAELQGLVLSASTGKPPPIAAVGRLLAQVERFRLGAHGRSALIRALAFDAFNKPFGTRTRFEWLSRDTAEVDRYVADPLCGFDASVALWQDVLELVSQNARPEHQARIPRDLPIYVFAGSEDMASERTKGLQQLLGAYRVQGLRDVTHRFYEGGRHEMLNETNRDEVHRDLVAWLDARFAR